MTVGLHGGGFRYVLVRNSDSQSNDLTFRHLGPEVDADRSIVLTVDRRDRTIAFVATLAPLGASQPFRQQIGDIRLYDRIWAEGRPASHTDENLIKLGRRVVNDTPDGSERPDWIGLPAAYTYFGQFIAHDLSHLDWNKLQPDLAFTPALDLSSLFGSETLKWGPQAPIVGETTGGHPFDLPRDNDGRPRVADERNDANLGLSQVHVMLARFHLALKARCALSEEDARRVTRWHVQHVVLHDYLPRIVGQALIDEIMAHGRALFNPTTFFTPVEFSAAAFQFGHSMVRHSYERWAGELPASASSLMEFSYVGGGLQADATGGKAVPDDWLMPWPRMLPETGASVPDPIHAAGMTARLAPDLGRIEPRFVKTPLRLDIDTPEIPKLDTVNLAVQTLLRGGLLQIPSAQMILAAAQATLAGSPPRLPLIGLTRDEMIAALTPSSDQLRAALQNGLSVLLDETPLWFYTLLEGRHHAGTGHLGPLSGRIVAETIHAAIAADPDSILHAPFDPANFICSCGEGQGRPFDLWAMMTIAMSSNQTNRRSEE